MRTVICGMGEVGRHLAAELADAGYDVIAVDASRQALREVEGAMDVYTLPGEVPLPEVLDEAGVGKADLVVGVTNHETINLTTAWMARERGAKITVARLEKPAYFPDRTGWMEGMLGVNLALCPGLLAGAEVVRTTRAGILEHVDNFAGHLVQVMAVRVKEGVPAAGRSASQLTLPPRCRVLAVIRDGVPQTPSSVHRLQPEDEVIVSGPTHTLYQVDELFRGEARRHGRAIVVGGNEMGENVATELLKKMGSVLLADRDQARCEDLASRLTGIEVMQGEGTSIPFLEELEVGRARTFVAATRADEVNLMSSLLSKKLGAEQAIALLHRPDYADVYEALGIDSTVSPRLLLSREILRFLRRRQGAVESTLPMADSTVLELQVAATSSLVGQRLFDLNLSHGVVPMAVARGRKLLDEPELTPLEAGDVLVVYTPDSALRGTRRALLRR